MDEKLISKKDLLDMTGISYGQLYRWKRKKIIPEEWFIKKSVSTGQETFFPMEKILERVKSILELKDEVSLDELANKFTTNVKNSEIRRTYILENNIVSEFVLSKYEEIFEVKDSYCGDDLLSVMIFRDIIESAAVTIDETKEIVLALKSNYKALDSNDKLFIKRKLGVLFYYVTNKGEILEDQMAKTILIIDFDALKVSVNNIL